MTEVVTPSPPSQGAVADLRRRALAEMNRLLRQRRHRKLWENADTFRDLCRLGEQFVLGQLSLTPGHGGPRMPETREIGPALAHANRAGFLTIGSQPGEDPDEAGRQQRAAVQGHANDEVLEKLRVVFADLRPHRIRMTVQGTYPWRNDHSTDLTVTASIHGQEFTAFGARLSKSEIVRMWGSIQSALIEEILGMHTITIIDREWGRHTLLWDRLMKL